MKSPIKDLTKQASLATATLKRLIPRGSVVDSYGFYSGEVELNLASCDRFFNVHVSSYPVFEFWECLQYDPSIIYEMASGPLFKFEEEMFSLLQESWHTYDDPYIRAALFFILNRCSAKGLVSRGELSTKNYTPMALSYLKRFDIPPNLYLNYVQSKEVSMMIREETEADFVFVLCSPFTYNFFHEGEGLGIEETFLDHRQLNEKMKSLSMKWILYYDYHPSLRSLYSDATFRMLNKYGTETTSEKQCAGVLISNF